MEFSNNVAFGIGLMSGTSMDGIDAALVRIERTANGDKLDFIDFYYEPYPETVRAELMQLAGGQYGGSRSLCLMNSLLGKLYADCVGSFLQRINFPCEKLDFIASHGQTLYHSLAPETYLSFEVSGSLQLGEASYLTERFHCPVISDFRVRDVAAGGLGAPLVPFVEKSLYRNPTKNLVYLNIGGISNITFVPKSGDDFLAFDTGPGNMLIDQAMEHYSQGRQHFDQDGAFGKNGTISATMLDLWMNNPYYRLSPPKNSGRENFGAETFQAMFQEAQAHGVEGPDFVATLTRLTARVNAQAVLAFCPTAPDTLIVSGGGSRNPNIMKGLQEELPQVEVISGDILGYPNEAKEAIAFAYLGYKTLMKENNTLPRVTGAQHTVCMGKVSL